MDFQQHALGLLTLALHNKNLNSKKGLKWTFCLFHKATGNFYFSVLGKHLIFKKIPHTEKKREGGVGGRGILHYPFKVEAL